MKTSNRLLLWFGVAIGVLVIVTVALVLSTTRGSSTLLPEDTPEGTVQRFLLAMEQQDFAKAYSYLALDEKGQRVPYESWVQSIPRGSSGSGWKATIDKTTVSGDQATVIVTVSVLHPLRGPFNDPVSTNTLSFSLKKISGSWLIVSRPDIWYLFW